MTTLTEGRPGVGTGIIEARAPTEAIRRAYDLISVVYARLAAPLERKARMAALARAGIRPRDRVLEVAVGPGSTLVEILKLVGSGTLVFGVDLSPKMLKRARARVAKAGHTNVLFREADARRLPFPDGTFDVLYNSYMLDLIPLAEIPAVLAEFRRVLKPGGRLALVNFSKSDASRRTLYERFYLALPSAWVPYVLGGCRPVLVQEAAEAAGLRVVHREFMPGAIPSEIILATKPDSPTTEPPKRQNVTTAPVEIVLVSGACCIPGMAPFDEQARQVIERASAETGIAARVEAMSATSAYFGGVPKLVMAQLIEAAGRGRMPVPAVLVNGRPVSLGVPSLELMKSALVGARQ